MRELYRLTLGAVLDYLLGLNAGERSILYILLALALGVGFLLGRRRPARGGGVRSFFSWRAPRFQNDGESLVSRVLLASFPGADHHLLNHLTLPMDGGTTQVDHVLVTGGGIVVIETKDYSGWIFGKADEPKWTQTFRRAKYTFQNPLRQNARHISAVQRLLPHVPAEAISSVVVFTGSAEFKTPIPDGVVLLDRLAEHIARHRAGALTHDQVALAVGRLEMARLALTRETDVEHIRRVTSWNARRR